MDEYSFSERDLMKSFVSIVLSWGFLTVICAVHSFGPEEFLFTEHRYEYCAWFITGALWVMGNAFGIIFTLLAVGRRNGDGIIRIPPHGRVAVVTAHIFTFIVMACTVTTFVFVSVGSLEIYNVANDWRTFVIPFLHGLLPVVIFAKLGLNSGKACYSSLSSITPRGHITTPRNNRGTSILPMDAPDTRSSQQNDLMMPTAPPAIASDYITSRS